MVDPFVQISPQASHPTTKIVKLGNMLGIKMQIAQISITSIVALKKQLHLFEKT